ncbi:MAG: hypothetical protein BWY66_01045 [bacterium ADurb.Bin374]|nr:MAG: hypothetical protein BWY66_01045 [bacterium ADurb.Bin374]
MTSLMPGQSPPQLTMPIFVFAGSKNILSRGPARSKVIGCLFSAMHFWTAFQETL